MPRRTIGSDLNGAELVVSPGCRQYRRLRRRRTSRGSDPEYRPWNVNCEANLETTLWGDENFPPCRRSGRLLGKHQKSAQIAQLVELRDAGGRRNADCDEKLSEISDFLDLDDDMLTDLNLFDGVDSVSNRELSGVTKSEPNRMVEALSTQKPDSNDEKCMIPPLEIVLKKEDEPPSAAVGGRAKKSSGRKKSSKNICPVCQKSFQQLGHLRSHYLLHTGERPFVCEICNKSFAQSGHLISHINSHTSNRPYGCDFCDKRFTQSGHKRNHERSHLGIRPYGCIHCDKKFTQSGHLVNHLRIHDGDKPYVCEICGKTFTQSGHLSSHKRTHFSVVKMELSEGVL